MNLSAPFILRPVATLLLSVAILLVGALSFGLLPVSPLPKMDFPAITVEASLAGASPQIMASSVATPLERALGGIAGISEMTSRSSQGSTRINILFDIGRDIDAAAREVQAAINAARTLLPSGMRSMPTYRKINPSQAPIMVLSLTSPVLDKGQLYDVASSIVAQKLSQVSGVGQVQVGGSSLPAVRIELEPRLLDQYNIALDEVRQAIAAANVRRPKGAVEDGERHWQVQASDQLERAADYRPLVIRYQNDGPVRLSDVARVHDGLEDRYNSGFYNDEDAVLVIVYRQADANILETITEIRDRLPMLRAVIPASVELEVAMDRSPVIRATLHEAERTLLIAVALVILVVLAFLGHWRAALIPALAVPVSLVGSFAVMYLWGFSLNNLSLMALIIATGLVVDDAIVVLENIARHIEEGEKPLAAALKGSREVGFTLLSMNLSLVVVFLSILFMGGIIERLFREFSITLAVAILISLLVSLTLTPMLCARWLKSGQEARAPGRLGRFAGRLQARVLAGYARSLDWALRHSTLMLVGLLATMALNVYLYVEVPKTFMPQQDAGQLSGFVRGDDGLSFQVMQPKLEEFRKALLADPAVQSVAGFSGGSGGVSNAMLMIRLKPIAERGLSAQQVIDRLRKNMPKVPGGQMYLMADQDLQFGGRQGRTSENEFVLLSSDLDLLNVWLPKVREALAALPQLTDIEAKQGDGAQQIRLVVDRESAKRLGVDMDMITAVLNNAFSQRQISTIYNDLNQYKVVMEIDPKYAQSPQALDMVQVITDDGLRVPLSAFARWELGLEEDRVQHQGQFAAENISYSVAPGYSALEANQAIEQAVARVGLPTEVQGILGGTSGALQQAQKAQPLMILGALMVVYIVLGILYESYVHPLTILSTLPSAGVGALLAIELVGDEFSLISLLGLFLLIGVVKKNAILMIDLALHLERQERLSPEESIRRACLLRFRPILMTTLSAILGAVPLLLDTAEGAEMRRPLGIAIVGGLVLSQLLTLYSTPAVYLFFDRLRHRFNRWRGVRSDAALDTSL
ncbi:acriflavin resistance protein, AcrB/AcrD/AcrF family [Azotobacter vinelandii CA]|uniref:Acriflavin resistance protein, AcrB/AcrD/AcrF family n=2 Tax=Azotobacter vinelandii TaxID=354 RepID=C1DLW3_AZOVD|nr:efflux RND transporter permease subunit [Azotobacter vinelandii]ACO79050.1 acriflavin resistance protein, AcrB/AcrD/AcrF family [Azotobacter vinelandii DJ]AGK16526.1 acriflavin resistance protein, AcrB/AcrD/AcrF family [Azotobacter vinelandii CA]AGK20925.1 acriflavin resistance protein, AcrB/AcrD/AcrF family [Azotobacter vinelandii CA6]WKN20032.1 efflux RND transporter permease subunit [Azotobacter vinelandii]SFX51941.1 multidrug efflux pump [Azotobacter vinelandii]